MVNKPTWTVFGKNLTMLSTVGTSSRSNVIVVPRYRRPSKLAGSARWHLVSTFAKSATYSTTTHPRQYSTATNVVHARQVAARTSSTVTHAKSAWASKPSEITTTTRKKCALAAKKSWISTAKASVCSWGAATKCTDTASRCLLWATRLVRYARVAALCPPCKLLWSAVVPWKSLPSRLKKLE